MCRIRRDERQHKGGENELTVWDKNACTCTAAAGSCSSAFYYLPSILSTLLGHDELLVYTFKTDDRNADCYDVD